MDTVPNSQAQVVENASELHIPRQKSDHSTPLTFRNPPNLFKSQFHGADDSKVLCQGFSIREYVCNVRSVNIRKCWPFSESLLDDGNPHLPPLERPNYRWRVSQPSVETDGEHQFHGASCHMLEVHGTQPENPTGKIDRIMFSLDPFEDKDPGISKELEEEILKFSRVKISEHDDNSGKRKDGLRKRGSRDESRNDYGRRLSSSVPPFVRAATSTLKCTSKSYGGRDPQMPGLHKNGKADSNVHKAQINKNQNGKPDNGLQVHTFTSDSKGREYKSVSDVGVREDLEKAKRATQVEEEQVTARSILLQSERNRSDNLNLQATRTESVRDGTCDMTDNEVCGVKVCPVCKTFTSTTITAVNAHIDDCLAQASDIQRKQGKMHRQKSRTQKKRSIVDICAAAPPVEGSSDYLENLEMDESTASATANRKVKKSKALIEKLCVENGICDSLLKFNCKGKETNGKAGKRKVDSVKPKTKRQRFGIASSVSNAFEAHKMQFAATHSKETDHVVEHNLKASSITVDARDSNVEQPPRMQLQVHSVENYLAKNQPQQSGILMDHIHFANMIPKENKAMEGSIFNDLTPVEENGMVIPEENTGKSFSILSMENAITDVSQSYGMKVPAPAQNQSSHSENDKSDLLDDNECRHHKACSTDASRLQVQEASKPPHPNLLNISDKNPVNKNVTPLDHDQSGEAEQFSGAYSKSECCFMHSLEEERTSVQPDISDMYPEQVEFRNAFAVKTEGKNSQQTNVNHNLGDNRNSSSTQSFEWEKENSKSLHSLQKERQIWETGKVLEGAHVRSARLNLNKKVCVLPRDSNGRFLSSHGMNDGNEEYIHNHQQKQTCSQKYMKPPRSFPHTSTAEKETRHTDAYLSESATDFVNFNIHGDRSDYGYRGFPLDSQGELVNHIPNTSSGFNQLYKIPNYSTANEAAVSQGTKALGEFNFVESMKTFPDVTSVNQPLQIYSLNCLPQQNYSFQHRYPDYLQEYSVLKTNQSNPNKADSEYYSLLDQDQRDGSSHVTNCGSSIGPPDTISMLFMQAADQSGCNGDQRIKADFLKKTYPEVDIKRRKQFTTQPVMRLMGQSFTIGNEHKAENALKDPQQCNGRDTKSTSGATIHGSSSIQLMTDYMDRNIACNISKSFSNNWQEAQSQEMSHCDIIATHEVSTLNNDAPKLLERRLPKDNVLHGQPLKDQNYSHQAWISSPPFSAPIANMLIPPTRKFCNTSLNEANKMAYKHSHISNQGFPLQKQTYSHLLSPCLGQHTFQNAVCNGWKHGGNPYLPPIQQPDAVYSVPCSIKSSGCLSGPLHAVTCALAHSASIPNETRSHCQTPSSTSIADSPTLAMQGKCMNSTINLAEEEILISKLPNNMTSNRCEARHDKGGVNDTIDFDNEYAAILSTRDRVQETEALDGKRIFEKHQDSVRGQMQKSEQHWTTQDVHKRKKVIPQQISSSSVSAKHLKSREISERNMLDVRRGKICRMNDSWVEFAMDGRNSSKKVVENESILNARPLSQLPQKFPQKERGIFTKPNNMFLETGIGTSAIGLHYSSAESSIELVEPVKLSGGVKHILKPSSQNGNGKHSMPIHYTLPFSEITAEEREKIGRCNCI